MNKYKILKSYWVKQYDAMEHVTNIVMQVVLLFLANFWNKCFKNIFKYVFQKMIEVTVMKNCKYRRLHTSVEDLNLVIAYFWKDNVFLALKQYTTK